MQINAETLWQFAETTSKKFTDADSGILATYVRGSLVLEADPFLGGTTDIDLVFIHDDTPPVSREILRLTDEVHLDIFHHSQEKYLQGRELRVHPWMGPALFNAKILYDPQHFLDFTLASVRGLFNRPDNRFERARPLIQNARQLWLELQGEEKSRQFVVSYLNSLRQAANALARLAGELLTERRFLPQFFETVEALDKPGMYPGIIGMLGGHQIEVETLQAWLPAWSESFDALPATERPPNLHAYRRGYYLRAFEEMTHSRRPTDALWPLLHTWTQAIAATSDESPTIAGWRQACGQLGLIDEQRQDRLAGLDIYLEQIEAFIEKWRQEHGA